MATVVTTVFSIGTSRFSKTFLLLADEDDFTALPVKKAHARLCSHGIWVLSDGVINRTTSPSPTLKIVLARFSTSTTTLSKTLDRRLMLKWSSVSLCIMTLSRYKTYLFADGATTSIVNSGTYFQPGQQISISAPDASHVTFSNSMHDRATCCNKRNWHSCTEFQAPKRP
jgi:hypothetical protein